jgi:hypothetical protein
VELPAADGRVEDRARAALRRLRAVPTGREMGAAVFDNHLETMTVITDLG